MKTAVSRGAVQMKPALYPNQVFWSRDPAGSKEKNLLSKNTESLYNQQYENFGE